MKTIIHYKNKMYLPITETWIYGQLKNLKRYSPIVYCQGTQNLDVFPVARIRPLGLIKEITSIQTLFEWAWNRIFKFHFLSIFFLLKDKPSLIHAHFGVAGYSFLVLKKLFRLPLITTFYGYDLSMLPQRYPRWRKRYKRLFTHGDYFLVEGSHMKKCLIELGCPIEKIIVQHLGVDLDRIKFMPRKVRKGEEIKVLICASFREKKGIPYAIWAFAKVKASNPKLRLKLTIIGDSAGFPEAEKEKKNIYNRIKEGRLDDSVTLMGYQPYSVVIEELYRHHIFLSPSISASDGDTEGGVPVSIIEASASGMPVLSTRHCDIPEVILDGQSGYLVPERDVDALGDKLEYLVFNPDIWEDMGFKGRKHIEDKYNIKIQVQLLEEIYHRVVSKKSLLDFTTSCVY